MAAEVSARRQILYVVTTYVRASDGAEVEEISDRMAAAICGSAHDDRADAACPNPWFMVTHDASAEEEAEWGPLVDDR